MQYLHTTKVADDDPIHAFDLSHGADVEYDQIFF